MQITFTGRHIEVTPALKAFTEEKMQRLQHRHSNLDKMHVIFHVEKNSQVAEGTVHINGTDIHASAESADMYTSIDQLVDKLITQITKHKEKHSEHR